MRILPPPLNEQKFRQFLKKYKREPIDQELRPNKRYIPVEVFIEEEK